MNAPAPADTEIAVVIIVMGLVILAPTILIVAAVVAGRFRNPKDDP